MDGKGQPYLTKSRFMAGLDCQKQLWLSWHDRGPYHDPDPGSPEDLGIQIGQFAHQTFPGGVLVDNPPWEHKEAVEQTQRLLDDPETTAIFEAAFEYDGVRVRADIIERVNQEQWALHEVKSTSSVKDRHLPDIAIQAYVIEGAGVDLAQAGLIHINSDYLRGEDAIDWFQLLARADLTDTVMGLVEQVPDQIGDFHGVLGLNQAPNIEPGKHCPGGCPFWEHCTADKPDDWVFNLPGLREARFLELTGQGYEAIKDIPDDVDLTVQQRKVRNAVITGEEFVSGEIGEALKPFSPPAYYLDFETIMSPIPLYPETSPYQLIPFQWSIHHLDQNGGVTHQEFLAIGDEDPRRILAESLLSALGENDDPIIHYSPYEKTVIRRLAKDLPDLAVPLEALVERHLDLLTLVRAHYYHPKFGGSFSIKAVGPALAPDLSYDNLKTVSGGMAAGAAYFQLARGQVQTEEDVNKLRSGLLAYCFQDSLLMVRVHQALIERNSRS